MVSCTSLLTFWVSEHPSLAAGEERGRGPGSGRLLGAGAAAVTWWEQHRVGDRPTDPPAPHPETPCSRTPSGQCHHLPLPAQDGRQTRPTLGTCQNLLECSVLSVFSHDSQTHTRRKSPGKGSSTKALSVHLFF